MFFLLFYVTCAFNVAPDNIQKTTVNIHSFPFKLFLNVRTLLVCYSVWSMWSLQIWLFLQQNNKIRISIFPAVPWKQSGLHNSNLYQSVYLNPACRGCECPWMYFSIIPEPKICWKYNQLRCLILFGVVNIKKPFLQSHLVQEKLTKEIYSVLLIKISPVWVLRTDANYFLKSLSHFYFSHSHKADCF